MGENKLFIFSFFLAITMHGLIFFPVFFIPKSNDGILISLINGLKKDRDSKLVKRSNDFKSNKYTQKSKNRKDVTKGISKKVTLKPMDFKGVLKLPIIENKNFLLLRSIEEKISSLMDEFSFHGLGRAVFTVEFDYKGDIKSLYISGIEGDQAIVDDIKELLYLGQPYFNKQNSLKETFLVQLYFEIQSN